MTDTQGSLRRRLGLPLLVLYGTGVAIGAGIYVLIGAVASHAGVHAPLAFIIAAVVMGLTVASYTELCTRYPVAASEAAYVKGAFGSRILSTLTGFVMVLTGVVASATVTLGAAGYMAEFTNLPRPLVVCIVVIAVALVAAWGVLQSVILASLFTVIELAGLGAIIVAAAHAGTPIGPALLTLPEFSTAAWAGIGFASLLAFFAFIGFEDLTNMIEEARRPERDIPLSMVITLAITTILYVLIAAIAVTAVPVERLAGSDAPLAMVFRELAGVSPATIAAIAIVASLNTIIAEMTMASRVVYGLARLGDLPRSLAAVNSTTGTPLIATALIAGLALLLALLAPLERLAEFTSLMTLIVFAMINLALLKLRWDGVETRPGQIRVPVVVPVLGLLTCVAMIAVAVI
jgi:amino acid transporter